MVSIGSGQPLGGGFDVPERLVTKVPGLPLGGDFDAPDILAAKAGRENFPVASRLLPRASREALMAIYGFARLTDDLGDEAPGDRLELLDWLDNDIERAEAGKAVHPVCRQLSPVIAQYHLSLEPFRQLIEANRMDQRVARYESFGDLVEYCMLSAAPVGRLVLAIFELSSPERVVLSDKVCIGLQLVEHLQDIGEDAARGRIYMPAEDMRRVGCTETDLLALTAPASAARVGRARGHSGPWPARCRPVARKDAPVAIKSGSRRFCRWRHGGPRLSRTGRQRRALD